MCVYMYMCMCVCLSPYDEVENIETLTLTCISYHNGLRLLALNIDVQYNHNSFALHKLDTTMIINFTVCNGCLPANGSTLYKTCF